MREGSFNIINKNKGFLTTISYLRFLLASVIVGVACAVLIFVFKCTAGVVIDFSEYVYGTVRDNAALLPILIVGLCGIGAIAYLFLRYAPNCKGGGIPTAIASLRGLISFSWVKSVVVLFISSVLTYLGGVPLGNEGPSVQMGSALGKGYVRLFASRDTAWNRYLMTGGACAGFAVATGAPLAGIFFAFEEAHKRFSPIIFTVASVTVISGTAVSRLLCEITGTSFSLFHFPVFERLPITSLWVAVLVGIVCGAVAVAFTRAYRAIRTLLNGRLSAMPFSLKIILTFVAVGIAGFAGAEFIGSGHDLVEELVYGSSAWYMLILYFCVRAILMMIANNVGVSGGLFVPTLAFGAMIGALVGGGICSLSFLDHRHYPIIVLIAITSALASFSRIPITAIVFSAEALCCSNNMLEIIVGVSFSYLIVELFGGASFTDAVIEAKVEDERRGKELIVVDTELAVMDGAFVVGKEIRDVLWPPNCVIMSVHKKRTDADEQGSDLREGDILQVHYQSYDPDETKRALEDLVGVQIDDSSTHIHTGDEEDIVPEI